MDFLLSETDNGGDISINGNDFAIVQGLANMPYLALFGGNVKGTTKPRVKGEIAKDYWGNNLFHPQNSSAQFNSLTEKTLMEVALTSAGMEKIKQAVEKDLEFMKEFALIKVVVSLVSDDHIKIQIEIRQPKNFNGSDFQVQIYEFAWNPTTQTLGDYKFDDYSDDYFVG